MTQVPQFGAGEDGALARPWSRRVVIAYGVTILVAAAAVAGVTIAHRDHVDRVTAPKPVLGSPLAPLPLYRASRTGQVTAGERVVPDTDLHGRSTILEGGAADVLSVQYARVRPIGGDHWFVDVVARQTDTAVMSSSDPPFTGVVGGRAVRVEPEGSPGGTGFLIDSESAYGMSETEAEALARSLTTSVTVARCTAKEITTNECA